MNHFTQNLIAVSKKLIVPEKLTPASFLGSFPEWPLSRRGGRELKDGIRSLVCALERGASRNCLQGPRDANPESSRALRAATPPTSGRRYLSWINQKEPLPPN
jgi:hypothetical protein